MTAGPPRRSSVPDRDRRTGRPTPSKHLFAYCAPPRLAAGQILVVLRTLAHANQVRIAAGRPADELAPDARAEADLAFDLLRPGIGRYRGWFFS